MENPEKKKMLPVILLIAGWNVFHFLSIKWEYIEEYEKVFDGIVFNEIPSSNLNCPDLKLNADNHLVIRLRFNFTSIFLRDNFHLFGFIDKRPYLIGEIVFERDEKLIEVLGFEFKIIDAPQDRVFSCRFCPYDEIDPGESSLLKIILKNRRNFEEEFKNFYNSSLVHI